MRYKTTVEQQRDGSLVMKDGAREAIGDMTFAYHALLAICDDQSSKKNAFVNGKDFFVESADGRLNSDRLKVTISKEFAQDAIAVLKSEYPGLEIKGEQPVQTNTTNYHPN
ncbi:hypothetical protein DGG96_19220 [Legionella qingyii]|uniref:Uncharacterized protein n=1 Tax=Legionella qingyii TaxID=2184757 RepID=A0A317TX70_9GAMM|nr:hypothetical protein [Legionella qingyii]PWY54034.1 hypothetical protein DGG96_19220 [Legionella qingyii]RUR19871.1 hypothetical protein ELY20_15230 [Legionella qingyii]RUR22343.1 hypothetical protein ELY16_14935 [Legionella qingyii]